MALFIDKETPLGVSATYWRITFYQYDIDKKEFLATLHGHLAESTRRDGKRPLVELYLTVRVETNGTATKTVLYIGNEEPVFSDDFPFPAEIDRIYLYDLLRDNVPYFSGATNA